MPITLILLLFCFLINCLYFFFHFQTQSVKSGYVIIIHNTNQCNYYIYYLHLLLSLLKVDEALHDVIDVCKRDMSYILYIAVIGLTTLCMKNWIWFWSSHLWYNQRWYTISWCSRDYEVPLSLSQHQHNNKNTKLI